MTRKGQLTVPVEIRRKYGIVQGSKVVFEDTPKGIVLKVVPKVEDLAGVDAGKMKIEQALKIIDKMRLEDRY